MIIAARVSDCGRRTRRVGAAGAVGGPAPVLPEAHQERPAGLGAAARLPLLHPDGLTRLLRRRAGRSAAPRGAPPGQAGATADHQPESADRAAGAARPRLPDARSVAAWPPRRPRQCSAATPTPASCSATPATRLAPGRRRGQPRPARPPWSTSSASLPREAMALYGLAGIGLRRAGRRHRSRGAVRSRRFRPRSTSSTDGSSVSTPTPTPTRSSRPYPASEPPRTGNPQTHRPLAVHPGPASSAGSSGWSARQRPQPRLHHRRLQPAAHLVCTSSKRAPRPEKSGFTGRTPVDHMLRRVVGRFRNTRRARVVFGQLDSAHGGDE